MRKLSSRCLAAADRTHAEYRLTTFAQRAGGMREAARILDAETEQIAAMMTTEMGKTMAGARQETAKCAAACRYYAEHAESHPGRRARRCGRRRRDRATCGTSRSGRCWPSCRGIFRSGRSMRFAAPALMAGNVGLLKHAWNVPQTALFLQDLFERVGLPRRCRSSPLLVGSDKVEAVAGGTAGSRRRRR